jgi:diketogulonate reductase-like aldo/keto reductase
VRSCRLTSRRRSSRKRPGILSCWLRGLTIGDRDDIAQFAERFSARLTRCIGFSNVTTGNIESAPVLLGDRQIATNRADIHSRMQDPLILTHCRDRNIPFAAYSPPGRGHDTQSANLQKTASAHGAAPARIALAVLMAKGIAFTPSAPGADRGKRRCAGYHAFRSSDRGNLTAGRRPAVEGRSPVPRLGPGMTLRRCLRHEQGTRE